tara:strand:+ start:1228 stop:1512 length:285 start_codon:yes stop_codon:yes gene_type:complete
MNHYEVKRMAKTLKMTRALTQLQDRMEVIGGYIDKGSKDYRVGLHESPDIPKIPEMVCSNLTEVAHEVDFFEEEVGLHKIDKNKLHPRSLYYKR